MGNIPSISDVITTFLDNFQPTPLHHHFDLHNYFTRQHFQFFCHFFLLKNSFYV